MAARRKQKITGRSGRHLLYIFGGLLLLGWFTKEDDLLGGIAVGRFADLAVLEANIFDEAAVPDDVIRNMKSVLTVVNGEVVYSR